MPEIPRFPGCLPPTGHPERSLTPRGVHLRIFAAAVLWGGTFAGSKLAVSGMPPMAGSTVRFSLASAVFLGALALDRRRRPEAQGRIGAREAGLLVLAGSAGIFLNGVGLFVGLTLAPAMDAALLVPTNNPLATALLAALILREPIGRRMAAGLAVAFAGVVVVVLAASGLASPGPEPGGGGGATRLLGDALFLVTVLGWSLYTVLARVAVRHLTVLQTTAWSTVAGAAATGLASIVEGRWAEMATVPVRAWAGFGYVTVFGTVVAFLLWNRGVAEVGAARAAAFLNLVPVVGVAVSAVALGEHLVPAQVVGAALVMAGVYLTTTGRR